MKAKYILRVSMLMSILASVFIFNGCKDDDKTDVTRLDSFGPSGVKHGEDITFIGAGMDKVTSVIMPVGIEVPSSSFKIHTATTIVLTVPDEATDGKVTLKTANGDIISKSTFGAEYVILVSTVTPEAKPGTNITFTGLYLNYVKQVTFTQGKAVTEFVSQSLTQLVVKVPLDAQSGKIVISDLKPKPQIVESEGFVATMPTVNDVTPLSLKHSDDLTISGTDLDLVSEIDFPNGAIVNSSSFVSQSVTQIVVKIPNTSKDGTLTLKVPSTLQIVTTQSIQIILPAATALSSSTPGTDMIITGTNLDLVGSLSFPGGSNVAASSFISQSPTSITVTIPSDAVAGTLKFITIHDFTVASSVPFGVQLELSYTVFNEGLVNSWQYWGWGGAADQANGEQAKDGAISLKKTYDNGYEGLQLGGGSVSLATYNTFNVSIYGAAGTDGKKIRLVINGGYGDGQYASLTIVEGQWTDFAVTFDQINNPTTITEIVMQSEFAGTIYVDKVGLK